jgi:hypothetical protein
MSGLLVNMVPILAIAAVLWFLRHSNVALGLPTKGKGIEYGGGGVD